MERPEPAVGQVWRNEQGYAYSIEAAFAYSDASYAIVWEHGGVGHGYVSPGAIVRETDTYVGQFAGFKVKETT